MISRLQASLSTQNWQSMKILEGFPRRYKIKSFLAHSPKPFCSWPNWRLQWRRCTVWQATRPPSTGEIWRRCHLRSSVHWKEEKIMVINFSRNPHQQNWGFLKLLFQFSLISSFHLFEEYYTKVFLHTGLSRYWKGLQAVGGGHRGEGQLPR